MEKMLAVVVDSEKKAYEASQALKQLDAEGNISIYALAVITKNADGSISAPESSAEFPVGTAGGIAVGALIGLLGGPAGSAIGAVAGGLAGGIGDFYVAGVDEQFVTDVSAKLTPGTFAVLADISEEWVTPVDTQMERIGGTVFRTPKKSVEEAERMAKKVKKITDQLDKLKEEQARAQGEYKTRLQASIDNLNTQLETQLNQIQQRSEQIRSEAQAKVQALQKKAEGAPANVKASIDAEEKQIRQDYDETDAKMRHALAEKLRETAGRVEKEPALTH